MKKGQGALEYLMTYGWALLVIVVVGAALFALGVLNPSTYTQKSCRGFNYFTYQDQQMSTNSFKLVVLNGAQTATITNMAVISGGNGDVGTLSMADDQGVPVSGAVSQGMKITISSPTSAKVATNLTAGSPYTYVVRLTYDTATLSGNVDQATCSGRVQ